MNKTETPPPVVLILTRRQAEALASLITRSEMHDRWVHSVRTQLPRSLAELNYQRSSAAGSAFAAARAVVDQARVDIMAEPDSHRRRPGRSQHREVGSEGSIDYCRGCGTRAKQEGRRRADRGPRTGSYRSPDRHRQRGGRLRSG